MSKRRNTSALGLPPLWRERMRSHRLERAHRRAIKQENYHSNGLNGPRAVARRQRQLANGQLHV